MPRLGNPFRVRKKLGPDDEVTIVLTFRELGRLKSILDDGPNNDPVRESIKFKIQDRLRGGGFRV